MDEPANGKTLNIQTSGSPQITTKQQQGSWDHEKVP